MTDRYYCVMGRIPGDDEDTVLTFGPCPRNIVKAAFTVRMLSDITVEDIAALEAEHGTPVLITAVLSSKSPITAD